MSDELDEWRSWIVRYAFIGGGISSFPYLDHYTALARVRGAVAGVRYAVAFAVDPFDMKRVVELL